jgi:antitoxin MazE
MRSNGRVLEWGNGLAIRLTKAVAASAGLALGDEITIQARAGKLLVQRREARSLVELLDDYDPTRHGADVAAAPNP